MDDKNIKVQKLLSQAGISSRRKAEKLIEDGLVKINGKQATIGDRASFDDLITVNNIPVEKQELEYYLLNKPKETISSTNDQFNRKTVVDLITSFKYLFPVGRLDYQTTGVLIITNDGELTNKLLHPKNQIKRVYLAVINSPLTIKELKFINSPSVMIDGKISKQMVIQTGSNQYQITLWEGRNHHVKKIFNLLNREIIELDRIEFAQLKYGNLKQGQYRQLTKKEIVKLFQ